MVMMPQNNPLTDDQLAELDRLHAAATPGEWQARTDIHCVCAEGKVIGNIVCDPPDAEKSMEYWPANSKYLAALHNAYPPLRQRLLAAESRLAEAERERDHWKKRTQPCSDYVIRLEQQAAQQRREGAAEWLGGYIRGMSDGNPGQPGSVVEILEAELKRLREGE